MFIQKLKPVESNAPDTPSPQKASREPEPGPSHSSHSSETGAPEIFAPKLDTRFEGEQFGSHKLVYARKVNESRQLRSFHLMSNRHPHCIKDYFSL